ncbi:restriction endonuclease [Actinomadura rudentiformis]|uniref:Restriction endonuclease n=1 Tax=Actinomadura rudentiformis TaxID=359158 RepID=A0A6H9YPE3_9ACTN|nr:restriction endonuclease [Actinomadura rudentiformis]KAB2340893.1 restriction endonuclease [Actinomadura rudentiformis]
MAPIDIPQYSELLWPTLEAVTRLGGSGSIEEIVEEVLNGERFSEQQQAVLHGDGPQTEIEYRLAWARTYLKGMGLLINSRRGVWSLTEHGRVATAPQVEKLHRKYVLKLREDRRRRQQEDLARVEQEDDGADQPHWRDELLSALMRVSPDAFERLTQRLLREAGFINTTVTGRSGDGGIDGVGVYRMSLVSFPVFFQCKRYSGSVGASAVRDFRGAMAGRGEKGLLVTTGTFTGDAKAEATRDGAPPVDLIDGQRLCDLLKEYDLGVRTTIRQVEDISVDTSFFDEV